MAIDPVSLNSALDQQTKTIGATQKLAADFNQFLTLLTVQLQNQDPLSPMDTTEFTNQLVAFSGVEQQINTNQKLDSLVAMMLGNSFSSSLGYVGMDISYVSSELNFDGTNPVKVTYALDKPALTSTINVIDEEGNIVYTTTGEKDLGRNEFIWDGSLTNGGKAEPGTYEVKVAAFDEDDQLITSKTVVTGRVHGIETQNGQVFLLVGDRAVSLANVLNASQPTTTPAEPEEEA